jgi:hypothetical protein
MSRIFGRGGGVLFVGRFVVIFSDSDCTGRRAFTAAALQNRFHSRFSAACLGSSFFLEHTIRQQKENTASRRNRDAFDVETSDAANVRLCPDPSSDDSTGDAYQDGNDETAGVRPGQEEFRQHACNQAHQYPSK